MVSGGTFTSFTGKNDGFDGEDLLVSAGTCSLQSLERSIIQVPMKE